MAGSNLLLHCGAQQVTREELDLLEPPPRTPSWVPVKHSVFLDSVAESLVRAGFEVRSTKLAVTRHGARFFGTLDLTAPLATGVNLAVAAVNSVDKSLPMKFLAGSHVFCCDNLALRSDLMSAVVRKHTANGQTRFAEALTRAVTSLHQFKDVERERIKKMQLTDLSEDAANSYMLKAFDQKLVSHTLLRQVLNEWRNPQFEEFQPRNKWSMLNAFTTVLGTTRLKSNPQQYAHTTIAVQGLLDDTPVRGEVVDAAE